MLNRDPHSIGHCSRGGRKCPVELHREGIWNFPGRRQLGPKVEIVGVVDQSISAGAELGPDKSQRILGILVEWMQEQAWLTGLGFFIDYRGQIDHRIALPRPCVQTSNQHERRTCVRLWLTRPVNSGNAS